MNPPGLNSSKPTQPTTIFFKQSKIKGAMRRFGGADWYKAFEWLEYSKERDAAFCFCCRVHGKNPHKAFTSEGFTDWKTASTVGK